MPIGRATDQRRASSGLARPCMSRAKSRHQVDRRVHQQATGPALRAIDGAGASQDQLAKGPRAIVGAQLMAEVGDQPLGLRARPRHRVGIEQPRDLAALGEIAVLVRAAHARFGIAPPAVEEVDRARDMDPGQQPGIGRAIFASRRASVPLTCSWIALTLAIAACAESRCPKVVTRDEARGPPQAAELILRDIAMIPHAAERLGMEHLRQQRGDPADHHRRDIAMHSPDHRARAGTAPRRRRGPAARPSPDR